VDPISQSSLTEAGPLKLVVVSEDVDLAQFIEVNLRLQGYGVLGAHDAETAMRLIAEHQPGLVIVDLVPSQVDRLGLIKLLRADAIAAAIPILVLTAGNKTDEKVAVLVAGVDGYIAKPFDTVELFARVRAILNRTHEYREVSPLTGLPGSTSILRDIARRLRSGADFAVCHIDIDRFKSVCDSYGPVRASDFILALARSIGNAIEASSPPSAFLGHIGGDDFVVLCDPDQVRPLTERAVVDFETAGDALYDPADRARGYLELTRRKGQIQRANLVTLSIGVAPVSGAAGHRPEEVLALASRMMSIAKTQPGSYVAVDVDRRR
jgi:diguanylate cyclase (GGDEF)-like protein